MLCLSQTNNFAVQKRICRGKALTQILPVLYQSKHGKGGKDFSQFVFKISSNLACEQAPDYVIREGKKKRFAEIAKGGLKREKPHLSSASG